jgi:hypothetical protein
LDEKKIEEDMRIDRFEGIEAWQPVESLKVE